MGSHALICLLVGASAWAEVAYGGTTYVLRWRWLDGDAARVVAEEDDRRTQVHLELRLPGQRLLGIDGHANAEVVTSTGERQIAAPQSAWIANPDATGPLRLPPLLVPLTRHSYSGLRRLSGQVTAVVALGPSTTSLLALHDWAVNTKRPLPEMPDAAITLERREPSLLVLRLNPTAAQACLRVQLRASDGAPLKPRQERRDPLPDGARLHLWCDTAKVATVALVHHTDLQRQTVGYALADLDLGVEIAGRTALQPAQSLGAEGF
jgi:hypothetical protein